MNRILSGIQPTGNPHLGNYLGALRNWARMQDTHECYYCVVDLHAITVPQEPQALKKSVRETTAALLASGIDPVKSAIFVQSAVPSHSELSWILSTFTPLGWLNRMTQFKEKASHLKSAEMRLLEYLKDLKLKDQLARDHESLLKELSSRIPSEANLGLYAYPVLMAADILVYRATHVPVGEDQKQHLELARDIAGTFNRHYKTEFFPLPEPVIMGEATRVMSLRDGTKKMSKSDESDYSRINLTDDADAIALKFKKAKTDAEPLPDNLAALEKRPEADNLVTIYAALADSTREKVLKEHAGAQFSKFKPALTELAVAKLAPVTARMRELMANAAEIDKVLIRGAEHANALADKNMREIKDIVGLWSLM